VIVSINSQTKIRVVQGEGTMWASCRRSRIEVWSALNISLLKQQKDRHFTAIEYNPCQFLTYRAYTTVLFINCLQTLPNFGSYCTIDHLAHQHHRRNWNFPRTNGTPPRLHRRRHPRDRENLRIRPPTARASVCIDP
jgi:hypothetical protein